MTDYDVDLLDQWIGRRDPEAFKEITLRHSSMVYGTCLRILGNTSDAEDAAQDCFLRIVGLSTPLRTSLASWLHTVAVHRCVDLIRSRLRRAERERSFAERRRASSKPTWNEIQIHVDEAIADLPEQFRVVIVGHFLEDQAHGLLSLHLGISRSAVSHRIRKGLEQIRRFLRRRGVSLTVSVLSVLMANRMIEAAPATLSAALGRMSLAASTTGAPGPAVSLGSSVSLKMVAIGGLMMIGKKILIAAIAASLLVLVLALHVFTGKQPMDGRPRHEDRVQGVLKVTPPPDPGGGDAIAAPFTQPKHRKEMERSGEDDADRGISGFVIDFSENRVPRARVISYPVYGKFVTDKGIERASQPFSRTTNGQGEFTFGAIPAAKYIVAASKGDEGTGYVNDVLIGSTGVVVALKPVGRVIGRVSDAVTGEGVEGVVVEALPQNLDESDMVEAELARLLAQETDAQGDYVLRVFLERTYRISVRDAKEYLVPPPFPLLLTIQEGEEVGEVDFALRLGGSISGSVFDTAGEGVADAKVKLLKVSHSSFRDTMTGEDGSFQFRGLRPGGAYTLFAQHEDQGTTGTEDVVLPAIEELVNVDLFFGSGYSVHGYVTDTADQAVAGMRLRMSAFRREGTRGVTSSYGKPVVTDENGTFSFQNVGAGLYTLSVDSSSEAYSLVEYVTFSMPPDTDLQDVKVVVRAKMPGSISGRVVDENGMGVAEAFVFAFSTQVNNIYGNASSQEDGTFSLKDLGGSDTYTLTARKPGYVEGKVDKVKVDSLDIEVRLRRAGNVHGKVVSAGSGDPIEEFEIRVAERCDVGQNKLHPTPDAWTEHRDPLGEFLLTDQAPGRLRIVVRAKGSGIARRDVIDVPSGGTAEAGEFSLSPGASVVGSVVSRQGEPLAGARVSTFEGPLELTRLDDGAGSYAMTDTDGAFRLEHLTPASEAHLAARCDGYAPYAVMDVNLRPDTPTRVSFILVPEAQLTGTVREESTPAPGISIFLEKEGKRFAFRTSGFTDANGRYTIRGLAEGQYRVYVNKVTPTTPPRATLRWKATVDLAEGQRRESDIDLAAE